MILLAALITAASVFSTSVSNHAMDCRWGFECPSGQPDFHYQRQSDLHRVSGREYDASIRHGRELESYVVFGSRYRSGQFSKLGNSLTGLPNNVAAFADFNWRLAVQGYTQVDYPARLVPKGLLGNTVAEYARGGATMFYASSVWAGDNVEAEGVAEITHGSSTQDRAGRHFLHRLVTRVVTDMLTHRRS